MRRVHGLLSRGNGKLGEGIHTWSLPAGGTCPGRTRACFRACYARQGRYHYPEVRRKLRRNLVQCRRDDFVPKVVDEATRKGVLVLRVHPSGDFFSAPYTRAWAAIARALPRVTVYAYTRSWRVPGLVPGLEELAAASNVRLWYSLDADSGTPVRVPPGVRLAYLQTEPGQEPENIDLVFRVRALRGERTPLSVLPVCPTETPEGTADGSNCGSCQRCFH